MEFDLNFNETMGSVDLMFEEDADIGVDFQGTVVSTTDHRLLLNRDATEQHPISAITGLQTELDSKADTEDIPTKVSELENDSGYLTEVGWNDIQNVPPALNNVTNDKLWTISVNQSGGLVFINAENLV